MKQYREYIKNLILIALKKNNGNANIITLCKYIQENHIEEINSMGDYKYIWQYDMRFASTELVKEGKIIKKRNGQKGVWSLKK